MGKIDDATGTVGETGTGGGTGGVGTCSDSLYNAKSFSRRLSTPA
jgi:hypothetical protein